MGKRTMAALGVALGMAAATPLAFAADDAKPAAKPAPPAAEAKAAKPADDTKGVKAAGPRLHMAHHGRNPGKDQDLRHCLDLPTAREVIRCSEGK